MKKLLCLALSAIMLFSFSACGEKKQEEEPQKVIPKKPDYVEVGENGSRTDDPVGFQLELPEVGEEIAVFETSMGDIYMRLFKKSAPITVTNFTGLINNGYYDGITFHRVIDGFMAQSGDPTATGSGGESVWGMNFIDEYNANLLNIRGSVAMANAGPGTNGSQFFINQNKTSHSKADLDYNTLFSNYKDLYEDQLKEMFNNYKKQYGEAFTKTYPDAKTYVNEYLKGFIGENLIISDKVSDEAWELYKSQGGNITLDGAFKTSGGHTVFAQVIKGMDVVDAICAVETNSSDKPLTDVVIKKAYITTFTEALKTELSPKTDDQPSSETSSVAE